MKFYSPLRYPGGKNKLAKFIALICEKNNINGHYIEPYAGGASVALFLLFNNYVKKITINDIDRSIYAFWHSTLNESDKLCNLIRKTEVNINSWKTQKEIQEHKKTAPLLKLGFSTLFLNRANMAGNINGGVIGGIKQLGKYKIDCRFNKEDLIGRIKRITEHKRKINLYNINALDLIKNIQHESKNSQTIFYFDPPYYLKGQFLYTNYYNHSNHLQISNAIKKIKKSRWIVSYDNVPKIKFLYCGFKKIEYSFCHTAYKPKEGREVLFFNKNLIIPKVSNPVKI
jgi:DNA adenine methylase